MRILHLLSNRKWTERAEPAADLAAAQQALGHEVRFVCGSRRSTDDPEDSVEVQVRRKGLDPIVLNMTKRFRWREARRDIPRLRSLILDHDVDVVHAHMENAHLLAALALRRLSPRPEGHADKPGSGRGTARLSAMRPRPLLVRTSYEGDGPAWGLRASWLLRRHTDGLIVIGEAARDAAARRFGLPDGRLETIEPGIDLAFFDPERPIEGGRAGCGFKPGQFVAGMVTRIRRDRRVDLVVEAFARLVPECPDARLLIVGRGEALEEITRQVDALGVGDRVRLAGYRRGDDLVAAYRAMDVFVYPVPGTDPSCRTVREAMASGVPVIASRMGFLPSLIEDGRTGYLVELSVEELRERLSDMYRDRDGDDMRSACLQVAGERFSRERQARRTLAFYERSAYARKLRRDK